MPTEKQKRTLRLMTAPDGRWPAPAPIDSPPVVLCYRDFRDRDREWRCTITRLRQGISTVMVEALRDNEPHAIPLKMHRITGVTEGAAHWPGDSYFTDRHGIEVKWTTGPRDAGLRE